jgi:hypothetical protein
MSTGSLRFDIIEPGAFSAHEAEIVAAFDRATEIFREATALLNAGR